MKILKLLLPFTLVYCTSAFCQETSTAKNSQYIPHNRNIEQLTENRRQVLGLSEGSGAGVAWLKDVEFSEGIIEFDTRGRDIFQKSFIGIAFHGLDNETYESVYFRPFNFHSADPVRKIHAIQYCFEPKFGFQELRDTHKDRYEAAIRPADTKSSEWFHVKVQVKKDKIRVFVNGDPVPCLEVVTLNPAPSGKKIGFWVGNNSNGDFAGLKISR